LKWRDTTTGALCGPLISEPEISVRTIEPTDEFLVVATDGLWDYYTPESSVVTQSRQRLRANNNDAQLTANWLVVEALQRQRGTLHSGTPGDNVTVMVIRLRLLPAIPRTSTSRLNLRRAPSDADSQKTN
jgi:serine/threonine protein phosphatase PrpC